MHSALLAGVNFAIACWLLAAAVLAVLGRATRRHHAMAWVAAALFLALAVSCVGHGIASLHAATSNLGMWRFGLITAQAAGVLGAALHLHVALLHARNPKTMPLAIGAYALAGLIELIVLRGGWAAFDDVRVAHVKAIGLDVIQAWAPPNLLSLSFFVLVPVLHLAAATLFGSSYLAGRRPSVFPFLGAGIVALFAVHDVLVLAGRMSGILCLPVAFALLAVLQQAASQAIHASVRHDFDTITGQLSDRILQVRRARRALRDMKGELGKKEHLAVVGEMAAVIANEVRNPLAVIANAVATLRRQGLARRDFDVLLEILNDEAHRLNRLVTDLLTYARPIALQRQCVVLAELSERASVLASHRCSAKVVFERESVRGQIWGDANLLRQVIDNLVDNAVQATGGAGSVRVSVQSALHDGRDGFVLAVIDDGEGMAQQIKARAKDPFFTTRPSGTGLGLAIVNRIVEAHGGELQLKSLLGEGSTVSVFLPVGAESSPPSESLRSLDAEPPISPRDLSTSDEVPKLGDSR